MADKKKSSTNTAKGNQKEIKGKKYPVKAESKRENKIEEKEVKIIQASKDYTDLLKRVVTCMYVIIGLLVIIGIIMVVAPKSSSWSGDNNDSEASEESLGEYDVSMFETITTDNLKKSVAGDTTKIVYIGRSTCGYCVQFLPVLQEAQDNYGYKTLYLDITTITTEDQQNKIMEFDNEDKFLEENFGSTPMVLAFKDGKMIDNWIGYAEYETFAEWVESIGFEKE